MMRIPEDFVLTCTEQTRVNLRAQSIYRRTAQVLPWGNIAESTRNELRRRALNEMWVDGTLLYGTREHGDDDGFSELVELDQEADEVIRGGH